MAESFGRLLQRYRVAVGLSQEQLAERAGISTNAISSLERGLRHAPHSATLDLLIAALSLDDDARRQFEEAARLARARRMQGHESDAPGDLPVDVHLNNLPPELTSFVDREKELPEIKELLRSHRLVTVVGTGGAGKTRCAIRIAGDVVGEFVDGVWLADLTAISDPALVSTIVARAMKAQEVPNRPMLETLLAYLKRKRVLLILDNCEHVIDEARRVVVAILNDCSDARILATSRERLSIAGEHAYRMPSLSAPSASGLLSANEVSQYGAVQLFSDRAFSANNRFILTAESAQHVADICTRLDGIPLAIELAAARVTALSPKQLAQKLDERFRVLTGGDRSSLPRHQTMRALIDWSYDLLSDDERRLFRRLSIFAGSFTLEAATDVCSDGAQDDMEAFDLLAALVDKSLVQTLAMESDTRYRLLESTRQYAREKLGDAREESVIARAHARAFLGLAERLYEAWQTTSDRAFHETVEPELENFRAALSWAFGTHGDTLVGQQLAGALRPVWGYFAPSEGRRWVKAAQERVTVETPAATLAMLDSAEASIAGVAREFRRSLTAAERALARYRDEGDRLGIIAAQGGAGAARVWLGQIAEGELLLAKALEAARSLGAQRSVIFLLESSALARTFAGDLAGARLLFEEALAAAQSLGAERFAAGIALNLAELEFAAGDAAAALRLIGEALTVLCQFGDSHHVASAWHDMAAYLVALRRFDEARAAARDALAAACDAEYSSGVAWSLQRLAAVAALRPSAGAPITESRRRAARVLGYVEARLATSGESREYTDRQEYEAIMTALRDALGDDELARLMTEGARWSEDHAIAEAMII